MTWQPVPEALNNLIKLLKESSSVKIAPEARAKIHEQLLSYNNVPDFNLYLLYILTSLTQEEEYIRTVAGLLLKNNIRERFVQIDGNFKRFMKDSILQLLGDSSTSVRRTVGIIITTFFSKEEKMSVVWPELFPTLVSYLDTSDSKKIDGAFGALLKICEDSPNKLEEEVDVRGEKPLDYLIPKFLSFFNSPQGILRQYAISCVNQFVIEMPSALLTRLESYLQGLFHLASDPNLEVKKRVCQAFVMLLEMRPEYLANYIRDIIKYMLHTTKDDDETVALEACEFWSVIAEQKIFHSTLKEFIPDLVPVLLNGMVYSDVDVILLSGETENDHMLADDPKDIKPRFYTSKHRASGKNDSSARTEDAQQPTTENTVNNENEDHEEEEEEDDEDDDYEVGEWNLRKCSAASLDILAGVYQAEMLPILLPHLQARLNKDSNQHEEWPTVESSILAIGAIAEGCMEGMTPHLGGLIPFLITKLRDKRPLIRSITCWTLSRYGRWITQANPENVFEKILSEFLVCILDNNKKVQEAACSAFATLEEEARSNLIPYLPQILSHLAQAFEKYQAKNLLILYDAVGTLADSVGSALNAPQHISVIMPPLIKKWNELPDNDRNLFPLLECLTSIVVSLGIGFGPFALPVYQRCLRLIENTLVAHSMSAQNGTEPPEKEFIVCALDLLSGLTEGLQGNAESLVANSSLIQLVLQCAKDGAQDVRQSAFALVGDLAKTCYPHLQPILQQLFEVLMSNLVPDFISVCNNASWAIGELALKMGSDIKPIVPNLLQKLVPTVKKNLNKGLLENTAITIGRLGLVCPADVAPHMEEFLQPWCLILRNLRDDKEKDSAFRGMCLMIQANPHGVMKHFVFICDAIASWYQPEPDLDTMFRSILHGFKNSVDQKAWAEYFATFPDPLKKVLQTKYAL